MKRFLILILLVCLLTGTVGCARSNENTCTFYYLRTEESIQYGQADALMAPVELEISGQNAELDYLLQLYLDGPTEANYYNPIPSGTYLLRAAEDDGSLVLVLSQEFTELDHIRLTLALSCLAATCHSLTGMEAIQVLSGGETYHFHINDCIFLDDSTGE